MEHKKTKIGIIIVIILMIAFIAVTYFYSKFSLGQVNLLTVETGKILNADLTEEIIDMDIKTEKDYAKIEKAVKKYLSKVQNVYLEMREMVSTINPNSIFSAQNIKDEELKEIDNILNEYKEKSQNYITEYQNIVAEDEILNSINDIDISARKEYYKNLYREIMTSEAMKLQYSKLEEQLKNQKGNLYEKLNKIEKTKEFLLENKDSWVIKDNKIQFNNLNRMTEYYNLLNQIID